MSKTFQLTLGASIKARYLKLKKLLVLTGATEDGREAEVRLPIEAMDVVLNAIQTAHGKGSLDEADLPEVGGLIHVRHVELEAVPNAGLTMRVILSDGREATLMFQSQAAEPVLRRAGEQIANGLALAIRGSSN